MKYNHALLYRWLIGNSFAFLAVYVAWLQGWLEVAFSTDASAITVAMTILFAIFWAASTFRMLHINREISRFLNRESEGIAAEYFENLRIKSANQGGGQIDQSMLASTLRARVLMPVQVFNFVANLMVLIALIGTVLGFVIATHGLGDVLAQGEGVEGVKGVVGQIVNGLGIAPAATLVGSILGGLWLGVHHQLLYNAASSLVVGIVEKAEIEVIPRLTVGADLPRPHAAPAVEPRLARTAEEAR
jgi:hypothetical protein